MDLDMQALKESLKALAKADPDFFEQLLDQRFLRNPHPPQRAGGQLVVDPSAHVSPSAHVQITDRHARIVIGAHSWIGSYAWLRAWGQGIVMGKHCSLHHYSMIQGQVTLGDYVRIGAHTVFIATEHKFERRDLPICQQGTRQKGIHVGHDVYIGSHVTVLDGVSIGDGVVLAAGAVVNRDIPPYCIAGGVPARVLKERPT